MGYGEVQPGGVFGMLAVFIHARSWGAYVAFGVALALATPSLSQIPPEQDGGHAAKGRHSASADQGGVAKGQPPITVSVTGDLKIEPGGRDAGQRADEQPGTPNRLFSFSITDALLAAFTLALVGIGAWQGYQLRRTVNAMRDTERRQLRAYVGIEKIEFDIQSKKSGYQPINPSAVGVIFNDFLVLHIRNFGQTPAFGVRSLNAIARLGFLNCFSAGYDYDSVLAGSPTSALGFTTRAYLNRDQIEINKTNLYDARTVWDAEAKQCTLVLFGRIYYRDAYDRPWSTKYCYVWEPWNPSGARFVQSQEFNGEDQQEEPPL